MGFRREKIRDYFLLDTNVENIFINEYMAGAPGDFVKVYLLALMYADLENELSNEQIANHLSLEHEDVLKAWTYWEKRGIIRKHRSNPDQKFDYDVEFLVIKEQLYGEKEQKKSYQDGSNLQTFLADKEIQDMFHEIERIAGRVLNTTEMREVQSWMEDFQATPEVIVFAWSYCVQKKKKNIKYIAAVVSNWSDMGLRDVLAVERYLSEGEKKQHQYKRVFQALGFSRNATEEERRIMDSWFDSMEYSLDKVLEACSKTSGISTPNINYVNKVLVNWYEEKTGHTADGKSKGLTTAEIMNYYDQLQRQDEEAAAARQQQVYETVPQIKSMEEEINSKSLELSRLIISDRIDREEAMQKIRERISHLNMEKAFLLTENGFELDYMDIKYKCPHCKDTGILETGEKCQCFGEVTREKINLLAKQKTE